MKNEIVQIGNIMATASKWDNPSVGRVYDTEGLAPTINTCAGGQTATHNSKHRGKNQIIVAMRGRNILNPSDRTAGAPTKQRLEPNYNGTTNTLTTVQKDNMVLEIEEV